MPVIPLALAVLGFLGNDPFLVRHDLANGVEVVVAHVPDASRQAFFTIVPHGLAHDEAGAAQYAHLVEHMLIRMTDPDELEVDGILLNGETTSSEMRLETLAPAGAWRDALSRHATWLAAREPIDPQVLTREVGRIRGELSSTVPAGFSHKWAVAGWNQVMRHGRDRAAVMGDVEAATAAEVGEYARRVVPIGASVQIVAIGPADPDEVASTIEEWVGGLDPRSADVAASDHDLGGDHVAAWDVPARHFMAWFPLNSDTAAGRVAEELLAQVLTMSVYRAASGLGGEVRAFASADLSTPEGRFLVISVGGFGEDQEDGVRRLVEDSVADVEEMLQVTPVAMLKQGFRSQAIDAPDFPALRRQMAGRPGAEYLEAQVMLTRIYTERRVGLTGDRLATGCAEVDREHLTQAALALKNGGGTLLLRPEESP